MKHRTFHVYPLEQRTKTDSLTSFQVSGGISPLLDWKVGIFVLTAIYADTKWNTFYQILLRIHYYHYCIRTYKIQVHVSWCFYSITFPCQDEETTPWRTFRLHQCQFYYGKFKRCGVSCSKKWEIRFELLFHLTLFFCFLHKMQALNCLRWNTWASRNFISFN